MGIHHITSFVGNAQANGDFYAGVLGLRLVKKTINFDAPEVYHLYFGNEAGSPGTIMTFFPFEGGRKGKVGGGQVGYTTFAVPTGAMPFWEARLASSSIPYARVERFGEAYIQFKDPDGLQLEIVEREAGEGSRWSFGGVPADMAIKGFGGAILYSMAPQRTMELLEEGMGLTRVGEESGFVRFRAAGDIGNVIDVNAEPMARGHGGSGTVHHIAWRAKDREDQEAWRSRIAEFGYPSTEIVDRNYFTATYFREQGEILFEIATDPPGFVGDEPFETLGEKLMLPEWYEPHREAIQRNLPPFEIRVRAEERV
jgi:glyoxalase family protein